MPGQTLLTLIYWPRQVLHILSAAFQGVPSHSHPLGMNISRG